MRGYQVDPYLLLTCLGGKKEEREIKKEKGREFRERGSTFSLGFPAIGPSNPGGARGKVDPPRQELRVDTCIVEFRKLREVGVFFLLGLVLV